MNNQESGRLGGTVTRDNHPTLCPLCGSLIKSRFFSEAGQKGGEATLKKYGREHYVRAGKMGGRGNKKNAPLLTEDVIEIHHKHSPIKVFEEAK